MSKSGNPPSLHGTTTLPISIPNLHSGRIPVQPLQSSALCTPIQIKPTWSPMIRHNQPTRCYAISWGYKMNSQEPHPCRKELTWGINRCENKWLQHRVIETLIKMWALTKKGGSVLRKRVVAALQRRGHLDWIWKNNGNSPCEQREKEDSNRGRRMPKAMEVRRGREGCTGK